MISEKAVTDNSDSIYSSLNNDSVTVSLYKHYIKCKTTKIIY